MESILVYNSFMESCIRDDFNFYNPAFTSSIELIKKSPYKVIAFDEIIENLCNGTTPSGGKFENKGIYFFRSQNFSPESLDFEDMRYVTKEFHDKLKRSALKPDDILIAVVGATIGVVSIVPKDLIEGNINQNVCKITLRKNSNVLPYYVMTFLDSKFGKFQLFKESTITAKGYINNDKIKRLLIVVPNLDIQKIISGLMQSAYFLRKQKLKQAEEKLDKINDYVLKELGINLSKIKDEKSFIISYSKITERDDYNYYDARVSNIMNEVVNGKYPFIHLGDKNTDILYGASLKNEYFDDGIPFLRINNLKPNKIDLSEIVYLNKNMKKALRNAFVKEGDLLMSRSGTIGIVVCVPKEVEGFAFGSYQIKFTLSKDVNPKYASIVLNTPIGTLQSERNTTGAVQMNITIPGIKNIKIPLPPLKIQNRIVNEVDNMMKESENLEKQSNEIVNKSKQIIEKLIINEPLSEQEDGFVSNVINESKKLRFTPE